MRISRQLLKSIVEHAQQSRPYECCGILMSTSGNGSVVDHVIPAENVEKDDPERRYTLGHKAHLKAVDMEALGEACIVGYYHSHPDGKPRPSNHDIEQSVSEVIYLITGLGNGKIQHAAWRFENNSPIPELLEVSE